jgi:hypothetical protein
VKRVPANTRISPVQDGCEDYAGHETSRQNILFGMYPTHCFFAVSGRLFAIRLHYQPLHFSAATLLYILDRCESLQDFIEAALYLCEG